MYNYSQVGCGIFDLRINWLMPTIDSSMIRLMFIMGIILVPFICHFSNTIFIVLLFLFYHFGNCWVLVLVFSPPFGTFVVEDCLTYFYQAACYQGPVYKVIIYKSHGAQCLIYYIRLDG